MPFLRAGLFGVCPSGLLAPAPRWIIGAIATPEAGAKPLNRPWGGPGEDTTLTISAELEAKKQQLIQKRLAEIPALDAEVVKSLVMKPNTFEIVPIK